MLGVALGTAALIIALSVFNGLENLIRTLYGSFDPDIKVTAVYGKSFQLDPAKIKKIAQYPGVREVAEIIEDNALMRYRDRQMIVKLKGVSKNYASLSHVDSTLISGRFLRETDSVPLAVVGQGIKYQLNLQLSDVFTPIQLLYPRNKKSLNINPENAFNQLAILPAGVFSIEKQYDESYVFVPLAFAQELLGYKNKRTSLEVAVKSEDDIASVQKGLKEILGDQFHVQNADEQHASLLRAIRIEKLFVYLTFSFIIGIASFNIFFSLTMLAIDKQKDVAILQTLGATPQLIREIFLKEGALIALVGAGTGVVIGLIVCLAQIQFGLVSMGMESAVSDAYPVKLKISDFILTSLTILIITLSASIGPALKAARTDLREQL